jgi:hypothetical protein
VTELEELEIELSAIEDALDRTLFVVEWNKLRAIEDKLNAKIKALRT